ncbi:unnamed protein product [Gemmata massiliana]|uniref:Uncharacterized protein n=1 Tax=Gemmata massiliana TaxID=1210884 RepID=A0A6P2DKT4_9BACT|nr:hypothetical protein [Gemmata massiliana]VTS03632.1 unnamed protein product [Gemmata massiliana]
MVAQASSAGGDRAPQQVRITFAVTIDVCIEPLPSAAVESPTVPEPATKRSSVIQWVAGTGAEYLMASADGRFAIVQPSAGTHQFDALDLWTDERAVIYDVLPSAMSWCEGRAAGVPLTWREDKSGWFAARSGPVLRVVCEQGHFRARDCRFGTDSKHRYSPLFDTLEGAQRWCEVRAACQIDGHANLTAPRYVTPANPQS